MKTLLLLIVAASVVIIPADNKGRVSHKLGSQTNTLSKTILEHSRKVEGVSGIADIDFLKGSFFVLRFY